MGSAKPASPFLNKRQKQSVGNLTKKNFYKIVVKIEAKHRVEMFIMQQLQYHHHSSFV